MNFTYASYVSLMNLIRDNGYLIVDYDNYSDYKGEKCCILRHDIDYDIKKAFVLSEIEKENRVTSTWFVIVSGELYNPFSTTNISLLRQMAKNGHKIGLHFDETAYAGLSVEEKITCAAEERDRLETILKVPIGAVSMHRPSRQALEGNWQFEKMRNSYSSEFFNEFKYVSDSRRQWREPVEDIIKAGEHKSIHILTHAFWYNEEEIDLRNSLLDYINIAKRERYDILNSNFSKLESVIGRVES